MIKQLSEKQAQIFDFVVDDSPYLICDGAVRTGKTVCMAAAFTLWAMETFDKCNLAICSKTLQTAERNILSPLMANEDLRCYEMSYKASKHMLVVRMGKRVNYFYIFGGKDESSYQLIQGMTLAGVLLDEVALMPKSFVDQAMARTLTFANAKIWFNCNPDSPTHWFRQEWILPIDTGKRRGAHLHFLLEDNPILTAVEIAKAKEMFHGVFYRRYIDGEWCVAEGALFTERPDVTDNPAFLRDGVAHIDAAYGGEDFTALTCGRRIGDTLYLYGRLWRAHVDTVMDAALADVSRLLCGPIYVETNGDKGYLGRELRNRGAAVRMYQEHQNKYLKISTLLRKWWGNVVFLSGTDPEYIAQIMDYTEEAEHDDAPDSAACVCRILDRRG